MDVSPLYVYLDESYHVFDRSFIRVSFSKGLLDSLKWLNIVLIRGSTDEPATRPIFGRPEGKCPTPAETLS